MTLGNSCNEIVLSSNHNRIWPEIFFSSFFFSSFTFMKYNISIPNKSQVHASRRTGSHCDVTNQHVRKAVECWGVEQNSTLEFESTFEIHSPISALQITSLATRKLTFRNFTNFSSKCPSLPVTMSSMLTTEFSTTMSIPSVDFGNLSALQLQDQHVLAPDSAIYKS